MASKTNKTWLVMDPGGKNFACTFIRNGFPIWMGYHPMVAEFQINKILFFDNFYKASKFLIDKCDCLIIERFISRQANAKVSTEKLNLMIGNIITIARSQNKNVFAKTASAWKRKYDYDDCIEDSRDIGFLKKDKHFIDTILMWCFITEQPEDYLLFLHRGLKAYRYFKFMEKWKKRTNTLSEEKQINQLRAFDEVIRLKKLLRSKGIKYEYY